LANDPSGPVQLNEEAEVWWRNYQAEVDNSIAAAEQHLEVPAGTISSIPNDPDFIATVKMYSVVEPILNELIASHPPRGTLLWLSPPQSESEYFRIFVTALKMEGRAGKLNLAEGMGLLTDKRIAFIRAVAQIRNRYAHNVKNMHRSLTDILTEEQRNSGSIVEHLTGLKFPLSPPSKLGNDLIKRFMYYRLADYLSEALQTLRPPPPPPSEGEILGILGTPPPTIEK
jgi:hypothetical protein